MPQVPYPITTESAEELRQQVWELLRQVFEDRIGGLLIGDVFQDSGDVLTLMLASSGGLTKSSNRLTLIVTSTGGLQLTSTGLATKLKSGGGITSSADGLEVDTSTFIPLSIFDANTILKADSDNTPEALTVAEQTILGRITGGEITGLTAAQVRTLLALATTDSPVFVTAKLSGLTDGKIPYHVDDATGLADGPNKTDVDTAITNSHARSHALDGTSDHSIGSLTNTYLVKSDGTKLAPASNTDADVASAVSLKHTQGSDTALGTLSTKNPPIDADKAIYRDSITSDGLVTSTWTQIKAFLKTYFDTIYDAIGAAAAVISDTAYDATSWDGVTTIAPSKNAVRDKIEAVIAASDDIIINRNIQETTANYSMAAGYNGVVLGPFTVGNGFTFTIADGDRFMVLND